MANSHVIRRDCGAPPARPPALCCPVCRRLCCQRVLVISALPIVNQSVAISSSSLLRSSQFFRMRAPRPARPVILILSHVSVRAKTCIYPVSAAAASQPRTSGTCSRRLLLQGRSRPGLGRNRRSDHTATCRNLSTYIHTHIHIDMSPYGPDPPAGTDSENLQKHECGGIGIKEYVDYDINRASAASERRELGPNQKLRAQNPSLSQKAWSRSMLPACH